MLLVPFFFIFFFSFVPSCCGVLDRFCLFDRRGRGEVFLFFRTICILLPAGFVESESPSCNLPYKIQKGKEVGIRDRETDR